MGDTPLHLAAAHNHLDVIPLLLQAGVDCTIKNNDGQLAEHLGSTAVANLIRLNHLRISHPASYTAEDYVDDSD